MAAVIALWSLSFRSASADEKTNENVEAVARQFIQAVKAKDLDALMKVSGVPWLDPFEERLIKDRMELRNFWQKKLADLDTSRIVMDSIAVTTFREFRDEYKGIGWEDFDKIRVQIAKELDVVLDDADWVVTINRNRVVTINGNFEKEPFGTHFILIRGRDENLEVVAGPSGYGFLTWGSRISKNSRAILEKADRLEFLSLDPKFEQEKPKDNFHGWRVLGRTVINDPKKIRQLIVALKQAAEESDGTVSGCFNPRHALRIQNRGQAVDFIVCFQCLHVLVYFGATNDDTDEGFNISNSSQPVFDKMLRESGIPLAEKE